MICYYHSPDRPELLEDPPVLPFRASKSPASVEAAASLFLSRARIWQSNQSSYSGRVQARLGILPQARKSYRNSNKAGHKMGRIFAINFEHNV